MSLQQIYRKFVTAPSSDALDPSATIHYITTGKSIEAPDAIVKHLLREQKLLKKRVEKTLSSVETANTLVLEVETEIEFVENGGYFLPGLDETFIADQVANFPMIHFVNFEGHLIKQIRLHWDQSCVLKQLGVIGRSGRNWPIQAGQDQCKLISKSVSLVPSVESVAAASQPHNNGRTSPSKSPVDGRRGRSESSHAARDPHASLLLHHEDNIVEERLIAPRMQSGFRPPARDLAAIIGQPDDSEQQAEVLSPPKARSQFSRVQTFDLGQEAEDQLPSPKAVPKTKKVDPKKYSHFEFNDGENEADVDQRAATGKKHNHAKHATSWAFEDFATPEKKPVKNRPGDVRHFGWSDDEENAVSPIKKGTTNHPRITKSGVSHNNDSLSNGGAAKTHINNRNQSHFSFKDESPESSDVARAPINNRNQSHFSFKDESPESSDVARAPINNRNQSHFSFKDKSPESSDVARAPINNRNQSHFSFKDESPESSDVARAPINNRNQSHFSFKDESPESSDFARAPVNNRNQSHFSLKDQSPAGPLANVSNTLHNSRRDALSQFEIVDESPKHASLPKKELGADRKAAVRQNQASWATYDNSDDEEGGFMAGLGPEEKPRGIAIAGNGQGNRVNPQNAWADGEISPTPKANVRSKTSGVHKQVEQSSGGFWDF